MGKRLVTNLMKKKRSLKQVAFLYFHSYEQDILRTSWGNVVKYGTTVHKHVLYVKSPPS